MTLPLHWRVTLIAVALFSWSLASLADVGATGEIKNVPGGGGPLCYQVGASRTAPDSAHFWLKVCNKGPADVQVVICAMLNLKKPDVPDDDFKIRKNTGRVGMPWECREVSIPRGSMPNAHLGCRLVTIPKGGKFKDIFSETVTFSTKFEDKELGSVYFDLLKACVVDQSCKPVRGKNKYLIPEEPSGHKDWVNTWAGTGGYLQLTTPTPTPTPTHTPTPTPTETPTPEPTPENGTPTPGPTGTPNLPSNTRGSARSQSARFARSLSAGALVGEKEWPSGNWVTMDKDNTEFFPARMTGIVSGAPAGSVIDFHFVGQPGGQYVVPADPMHPPCGGADVPVDEPFMLPPVSLGMTEDGIRVTLPAGPCGMLPEGAVTQLHAVVTAEPGAPIYDSGEFMYGIDILLVRDTAAPILESLHVEPVFDYLRIRVKATDVTTRALGSTVVTGEGDDAIQTPLAFANPPARGDQTRFFDMVGPLPTGAPLPYRIDVYDEVGNRASTAPGAVELEAPPAVPGLACVLSLQQQTVRARLGGGLTQRLLTKLDAAAKHAAAGRVRQALRKLEDYREGLARSEEDIEEDVAVALDEAAQECIAQLTS